MWKGRENLSGKGKGFGWWIGIERSTKLRFWVC